MARVSIDSVAPDFSLDDHRGNNVSLSELAETTHVLLVFNRGFT
jgi:peroxiredoxin